MMAGSFDDRLPVAEEDEEKARALRAAAGNNNFDAYPECGDCGGWIELMIDIRGDFPGSRLYWAHMGMIPDHQVRVSYPEGSADGG